MRFFNLSGTCPKPVSPTIIEEYPQDKNPFGEDEIFIEEPPKLRRQVQDNPKPMKRRPSRKSYRAPPPPKGVRPFSLIMQQEKSIF